MEILKPSLQYIDGRIYRVPILDGYEHDANGHIGKTNGNSFADIGANEFRVTESSEYDDDFDGDYDDRFRHAQRDVGNNSRHSTMLKPQNDVSKNYDQHGQANTKNLECGLTSSLDMTNDMKDSKNFNRNTNNANKPQTRPINNEYYLDDEEDESIIQTESGFTAKLSFPQQCLSILFVRKGEIKKKLEASTGATIEIPKFGGLDNSVAHCLINGRTRRSVASAKMRLEVMMDTARSKLPFTHFLSFKMTALSKKFEEFKLKVIDRCSSDRGVDSSTFQNPRKLHLTVATLTLLTEEEIENIVHILNKLVESEEARKTLSKPLDVAVKGLEYMNDDPSMVDVLYAKVCCQDGSNRLEELVEFVVDSLVKEGLMQKEYNHVKLHMTIMNSLMRKNPDQGMVPHQQASRKPRESFDASNILDIFIDHNFGAVSIDEIHISKRLTTGSDGFYVDDGVVRLHSG